MYIVYVGIKDFGVSIPGHGGVTDRMDCQIIMGLFVFVYYFNFVHQAPNAANIPSIINQIQQLNNNDKLNLYQQFTSQLLHEKLVT